MPQPVAAAPRPGGVQTAAVPVTEFGVPSEPLRRMQCQAPRAITRIDGPLARMSQKLARHEPVRIVAVGSSSTGGAGASTAAFSYPHRLEQELRQRAPDAVISVLNRGINGETIPQMLVRLERSVWADHPDVVLWQLGTNTVVRGGNVPAVYAMVRAGIRRMKARGVDVVLIDPQYAPRTVEALPASLAMVKLIAQAAQVEHIPVFRRFAVMRDWHEAQAIGFSTFIVDDGLHLNDWGYACWARLMADAMMEAVRREPVIAQAPGAMTTP